MRLVLNLIWLLLAGIWLAISYLITGVILCITIIGIPLVAGAALVPFGREVVRLEGLTSASPGAIVVPQTR